MSSYLHHGSPTQLLMDAICQDVQSNLAHWLQQTILPKQFYGNKQLPLQTGTPCQTCYRPF